MPGSLRTFEFPLPYCVANGFFGALARALPRRTIAVPKRAPTFPNPTDPGRVVLVPIRVIFFLILLSLRDYFQQAGFACPKDK
jgi:hypothetical protein